MNKGGEVFSDTTCIAQIALGLVKGVGNKLGRALLAEIGDVEGIFKEKGHRLKRIPGLRESTIREIVKGQVLNEAEKEYSFIKKNNVQILFFQSTNYPYRLRECEDAPLLLYYKGNVDFNAQHILSVVGTRRATDYGRQICKRFIEELANHYPSLIIVSGLAYGIDICAHQGALDHNLSTVAVLGHGLDRIYPYLHSSVAEKMLCKGALLSEFRSGTKPDRQNFVRRNRIIAGLADATLVVESPGHGGALITAHLAQGYSRDVLAVPGRVGDPFSEGCNGLIKRSVAALVENVGDIEYHLGWEPETKRVQERQLQLFHQLSPMEQQVLTVVREEKEAHINVLGFKTGLPVNQLSAVLLNLEFQGLVKGKPGNIYRLL